MAHQWRICDADLAGSVDFVGKLPDGNYVIMDWKRFEESSGSLGNSYGREVRHLSSTLMTQTHRSISAAEHLSIHPSSTTVIVSKMILASFIRGKPYFQTCACLGRRGQIGARVILPAAKPTRASS